MLIGEYIHSLDSKHRVSLPVKFRKELGRRVVMTHGLDGCLFLYSSSEWQKIMDKLSELPMGQADSRGFNRFLLAGAVDADVDGQGRILIPDFLTTFARLESKVVIAGVGTRVEIWDENAWSAYKRQIEGSADTLAEKLGDVGIL